MRAPAKRILNIISAVFWMNVKQTTFLSTIWTPTFAARFSATAAAVSAVVTFQRVSSMGGIASRLNAIEENSNQFGFSVRLTTDTVQGHGLWECQSNASRTGV